MRTPLTALAADRFEVSEDLGWQLRRDRFARNDSGGASYDRVMKSADGRPMIRGSLQFLMPHLTMSEIAGLVDLEFAPEICQDRHARPSPPAGRRLSLEEIVEFFTWAWTVAFDVLPLALGDLSPDGDPGGRPRASVYIINESSSDNGTESLLEELVDLSAFGVTHKKHQTRLDIAVIGRSSLPAHEARSVVRKALVRIAEDSGFDEADLVEW